MEKLKEKILNIVRSEYGEEGGIEIYTNHNDKLCDDDIKCIVSGNNPGVELFEILANYAFDYAMSYGYSDVIMCIKRQLNNEELVVFNKNSDYFVDLIEEQVYFYYDANKFNQKITFNVLLDNGNYNYDCTCDNFLNDNSNDFGKIVKNSSLLWLAKQQNKEREFIEAVSDFVENGELTKDYGIFVNSAIEDLKEMNFTESKTVAFNVSIPLLDYVAFFKSDKKGIILSKSTICGFCNPIWGDTSFFEIQLENDVYIPFEECYIEYTKEEYIYNETFKGTF